MAQKITQYQAVLQLAQQAPQIYNMPKLHRQMLDVLGIKNASQLVQLPEDMKPQDPITENQNILMMKPVKAFLYQDHQAHIAVHMAAMQDPKIMQLIGQNPQAQNMQSAMQAHISEHIAYEYRKQMEAEMGIDLPFHPDEDDQDQIGMPPEIEVRVSQLAAKASSVILQRDTQEMQAKQAQQAQQDPIVQMQMQELQLKAQEVAIKKAKMQADAAGKADQIEIEKQRIAAQKEIAAMQVGAKAQGEKLNLSAKQHLEGVKIGVDIAKTKDQLKLQAKQAQAQPKESTTEE